MDLKPQIRVGLPSAAGLSEGSPEFKVAAVLPLMGELDFSRKHHRVTTVSMNATVLIYLLE